MPNADLDARKHTGLVVEVTQVELLGIFSFEWRLGVITECLRNKSYLLGICLVRVWKLSVWLLGRSLRRNMLEDYLAIGFGIAVLLALQHVGLAVRFVLNPVVVLPDLRLKSFNSSSSGRLRFKQVSFAVHLVEVVGLVIVGLGVAVMRNH